jgi:triacylglycerol lipase
MTPRDYAILAQQAYSTAPDIGKADSASRAIVRTTADRLCVAFPGSDDLDCWLADFDALTVSVPGAGDVHRGFWDAWQAIAPAVLATIGDQSVTLTGHSMGGALAIMAAITLTLAGKPPVAVHCFEPPRVSPGVEIATMLSHVPMSLYKNGNDLVPDLPIEWHHAASLIHIGKAALPFPNTEDHELARVIEALAQA